MSPTKALLEGATTLMQHPEFPPEPVYDHLPDLHEDEPTPQCDTLSDSKQCWSPQDWTRLARRMERRCRFLERLLIQG